MFIYILPTVIPWIIHASGKQIQIGPCCSFKDSLTLYEIQTSKQENARCNCYIMLVAMFIWFIFSVSVLRRVKVIFFNLILCPLSLLVVITLHCHHCCRDLERADSEYSGVNVWNDLCKTKVYFETHAASSSMQSEVRLRLTILYFSFRFNLNV